MQIGQIRALTGVRFFAALWVVLFHMRLAYIDTLHQSFPNLIPTIEPILKSGYRGVDLFFLLSGFILALNYLDQLGPRISVSATGHYLWSRIARIWPLYMICVCWGGFVLILENRWFQTRPNLHEITTPNFVMQALMIQDWTPKSHRDITWNDPTWSISAEWLAYLLLPLMALVAYRLRAVCRARTLLTLASLTLVPLMLLVVAGHGTQPPYHWAARIMCEFAAGALASAAMSQLRLTDRQRALAGVGAIVFAAAAVGWLYLSSGVHRQWIDAAVPFFFLPMLCCLAVGTGPLIRLLSTRALVVGGGLSYALYLVHLPTLHLYRGLVGPRGIVHLDPLASLYGELLVIVGLVGLSWLMFRKIEEPARRTLRDMLAVEPPSKPDERNLRAA